MKKLIKAGILTLNFIVTLLTLGLGTEYYESGMLCYEYGYFTYYTSHSGIIFVGVMQTLCLLCGFYAVSYFISKKL